MPYNLDQSLGAAYGIESAIWERTLRALRTALPSSLILGNPDASGKKAPLGKGLALSSRIQSSRTVADVRII